MKRAALEWRLEALICFMCHNSIQVIFHSEFTSRPTIKTEILQKLPIMATERDGGCGWEGVFLRP